MYSNDIPGIDLISLCQKLQKRNESSKIVTSESVNKVFFIFIFLFCLE